jgi:hypothetical protein
VVFIFQNHVNRQIICFVRILVFLSVFITKEAKRYCGSVIFASNTPLPFSTLKMRTLLAYTFVVLSCLLEIVHANRTIIVPTKYGDVLGYETNIARIFYGIPFAKPPVGDLRYVLVSE